MRASTRRWYRQFSTRDIETIQRVSVTITSGSSSASVTPSPAVDWSRTLIAIVGWWNTFGGGADNDVPDQSFYVDVNGADVRANRNTGSGDTSVWIDLVTYRPGVIKRIQRGTISNGPGAPSTTDFALTHKVDTTKADLGFLLSKTNSVHGTAWPGRVSFVDEGTVRFTRNTDDGTSVASFECVEHY